MMRSLDDVFEILDWARGVFNCKKGGQVGGVCGNPDKNAKPVTTSENTTYREQEDNIFFKTVWKVPHCDTTRSRVVQTVKRTKQARSVALCSGAHNARHKICLVFFLKDR